MDDPYLNLFRDKCDIQPLIDLLHSKDREISMLLKTIGQNNVEAEQLRKEIDRMNEQIGRFLDERILTVMKETKMERRTEGNI